MRDSREISKLDFSMQMQEYAPEHWAIVAHVLEKVVAHVESCSKQTGSTSALPRASPLSHFYARGLPGISITNYMARIRRFAECSDCCYVLAFIYIDRFLQKNPTFVLSGYSIHRLIITSVLLGIKFYEDRYFDNAFYAKLGGISLDELNGLEVDMLFLLQFDLYIHPQTYSQYLLSLQSYLPPSPSLQDTPAAMDCSSPTPKPIPKTDSMNSMHTVPSANDLAEAP